ncbi:receptor-like protein 43 [Ipomoea triloba]|uniref:receptor-like protein 43 n=1 Tax=Ipomoea triloba TaxID=35885 RepID=UPI00125DD222|nr:receptor-like protein 43 [Ipomoea triloba]
MTSSPRTICFLLHIILLFTLPWETTSSERTQGRALVEWKNTLSNTDDFLRSWSIANLDNICWNWTGINCTNAGAVNEIKLENLNLSGTLKSFDFISFPNLTRFSLYNNTFTGSIPYAIANLSLLVNLDLGWNHFVNAIPTEIGRLTKLEFLNLAVNNLNGTIPSQIRHLQHLQLLSLYSNSLTGQIPEEIFSNLSRLQYFNCGRNQFQGPLPSNLFKLSRIEVIKLGETHFFHSIPPTIGNLSSLRLLDLGRNMLQGNIPGTVCNLNHLEVIDLYENSLDGVIPQCLGNITSLRYLSLNSNILRGGIPATLCNLNSLEGVSLSNNSLGGQIPQCLGNVTSLRYLFLRSNMLQGNIPRVLCNLHSLEGLILSNNSLGGPIPQCLGKLKALRTLLVSQNQLHGTIPQTLKLGNATNQITNSSLISGIELGLCGLSSLRFLDLSNNNLHGPLPQCLGNFSRKLEVINFADNQLQGTIPETWTKRNNLLYFNLKGNHLEGPLPQSLKNCNFLEILNLGNNKIVDTFPCWSDALRELRVLVLRSNQFHGEICNTSNTRFPFPKLYIFDISHNEFTGPLPRHYMENFEAMKHKNNGEILEYNDVSSLVLKGNDFLTGPGWNNRSDLLISLVWKGNEVPLPHYDLYTSLDLSNNNFNGEIPRSLGKLHFIVNLNLSHNQLAGYIPSSLGNLTNLQILDLSSNKLVGEIPEELARSLTFLSKFNLSYNHLSGHIPNGPQFDTFSNDSYLGNAALCGFPLTLQCQDKGEGHASSDTEDSQSFWIGFGWQSVVVGYSCGMPFGIALGYFMFKYGKPRWFIRLKNFMWQAAKGILPTRVKLRSRGVEVDPLCLICGEEEETDVHTLLNCRGIAKSGLLP